MMLIVPLPWSKRPWALPFLTVLAPSKAYNEANGKRHKTTVDWATQMIKRNRSLPPHYSTGIGEGAMPFLTSAMVWAI